MSIRSTIKGIGKKARKIVKKVGNAAGKYVAPALPVLGGAVFGPGGALIGGGAGAALSRLGAHESSVFKSRLKTVGITTGGAFALSGTVALVRGTGFLQSPFASTAPKLTAAQTLQAGKVSYAAAMVTGNPASAAAAAASGVVPTTAPVAAGGLGSTILKGVGTAAVGVGTSVLTGVLTQGASTRDVQQATTGIGGPVGWSGTGGGGLGLPGNFGLFPQPGEPKLGETGIPGSGGFGGWTLGSMDQGNDGSRGGLSPALAIGGLVAVALFMRAA